MARATGGVGGKKRMQRTDTVSIRLDPRLNYLCELAARSQRRSKSSFIEAAIADKIDQMQIQDWRDEDLPLSLGQRADYLWHIRESERLISLALAAPHLLTFEEQEIWALIAENAHFWRGRWEIDGEYEDWKWRRTESAIIRERVADSWADICNVASGDADWEILPKASTRRKRAEVVKPTIDLDDDIPF